MPYVYTKPIDELIPVRGPSYWWFGLSCFCRSVPCSALSGMPILHVIVQKKRFRVLPVNVQSSLASFALAAEIAIPSLA